MHPPSDIDRYGLDCVVYFTHYFPCLLKDKDMILSGTRRSQINAVYGKRVGVMVTVCFILQEEKRRMKEDIEKRRAEAAERRQKVDDSGDGEARKPFKCVSPRGSSLKVRNRAVNQPSHQLTRGNAKNS